MTNENGLQKNGSSREDLYKNWDKLAIVQTLYLIQGIPHGLTSCMPILLAAHGVTYTQQAAFSLAFWPYSAKLVLAPIVDGTYLGFLGRRKSWFIPVQLLAATFLFFLSPRINEMLDSKSVGLLSVIFFIFNFVIAAGDIVVDGWALKLLPKEIIGYASICNRIGFHSGIFIGFVVYMALESAAFCNMFLRSTPSDVGLITYPGYLWFWGCVTLFTTMIILCFVKEEAEMVDNDGIISTYKLLYKISLLPAMRTLIFILLTYHIGVGAGEAIVSFKLLKQGLPRDRVTLLLAPCIPFRAICSFILSRYTTGPKSLHVFEKCFIPRIASAVLYAILLNLSPRWLNEDMTYPVSVFLAFCIVDFLYSGLTLAMTLCMMSWFNRVSDPSYGGTYMTLLMTFLSLGFQWPHSLALWGVDHFTVTQCRLPDAPCETVLDGYNVEVVTFFVLGVLWLKLMRERLRNIQSLPDTAWRPRNPNLL